MSEVKRPSELIRREQTALDQLHRWTILDSRGNRAVRFEWDRSLDWGREPFWLTGGYIEYDVVLALAHLIEQCQRSTWEDDPDAFLANLFPAYDEKEVAV